MDQKYFRSWISDRPGLLSYFWLSGSIVLVLEHVLRGPLQAIGEAISSFDLRIQLFIISEAHSYFRR